MLAKGGRFLTDALKEAKIREGRKDQDSFSLEVWLSSPRSSKCLHHTPPRWRRFVGNSAPLFKQHTIIACGM